MTKELYEKLCKVIADYETNDNKDAYDNLVDMHDVLVEIRNTCSNIK